MNTSTTPNPVAERKLVLLDVTTRGASDETERRHMNSRVIGQDEAVAVALDALARSRNPLRDGDRPVAVIYELGPSRTGKTLVAETLAEILHGDKSSMVKINGGNYKQRHEVARLIGAPPGYLGYKAGDDSDGGRRGSRDEGDTHAKLTRKNLVASRGDSKNNVTVVLIDEANLMHPDFDDVLMSIFDKGELDLGNNQVTDFRDCIIILTSNIGMDEVRRKSRPRIGFTAERESGAVEHGDIERTVKSALEDRYRPEWLNRIDSFVVFRQHTGVQLFKIVDVELEKFYQRMELTLPRGQMFSLEVEDSAKKFLLATALADNGNIAQLKRALQQHLIDPLGNLLAQKLLANGDVVVVRHDDQAAALTFLRSEGERRGVAGDALGDVRDTPESQRGLGSSRRIGREQGSKVAPVDFDVLLKAPAESTMAMQSAELLRELREIYGIVVLRHSYAKIEPWTAVLRVRATRGQIEEFHKVNPELEISEVRDASGA